MVDSDQIQAALDELRQSVSRIEWAVAGDRDLGHKGLAARVEILELNQSGLEDKRQQGDSRVHDRVDKVDRRVDDVERSWDRARWMTLGAAVGSGLVAGGAGAFIQSLIVRTP
jgi:hypothetical protein